MVPNRDRKLSKLLSYVLRHRPESIGLTLDAQGWVGVDELLSAAARDGNRIAHEDLMRIVETSDKQRFALSEDGMRIRANQGHSVTVELGYDPVTPPETLFHGTAPQFIAAIRRDGLKPMRRHHVHLSPDRETAAEVGARRGKPVILEIAAGEMARAGILFYQSANGVWLTDSVPAAYLTFPNGE